MLFNATKTALQQIIGVIEVIQSLSPIKNDYLYKECNIGKHIRHISDHFLALKHGMNTKLVDYNNRNRGTEIESSCDAALLQIQQLIAWLETSEANDNSIDLDQEIKIFSEIDCLKTQNMTFSSNIAREFLYLINHTIHHAAHITIIAKQNGVKIPLNTGMAPCTRTFLRSQNS
jgi:uncharacterized damage-inducible protein DinB